jgi:hypothetical protein
MMVVLMLTWARLLGSGEVKTRLGRCKSHPPQEDSRAVGLFLATEHKAPAGAGVEIQRGHTSCA